MAWSVVADCHFAEKECVSRHQKVGLAYCRLMASKQKNNVAFSDDVATIFAGCRCHRCLAPATSMKI